VEYWQNIVDDYSKLNRDDYQVFAIFTMCRTLYSLKLGGIVSKPKAAQWAMTDLDDEWKALINQALHWQPGQALNSLEQVRNFIKFTIAASNNFYN
jgi:hypothetical protein